MIILTNTKEIQKTHQKATLNGHQRKETSMRKDCEQAHPSNGGDPETLHRNDTDPSRILIPFLATVAEHRGRAETISWLKVYVDS